jgi:lipopolysaccharide/colanic/teichoic acid biosynthesis glycosyltransferase
MKRLFDLIFSLAGFLVLSPIFIILSLLILITMGWPIFYRQIRVGRGGREFKIIKFRSMVKNAEKRGLAVTTGGDPRITPMGRFLRKTKLDELPQLLNVISGDMSLVGPRPEVPKYVALYDDRQRQVLSVRPGLTDPASIVYRHEEQILARYADTEKAYIEVLMPAKLKLNLAYIEKQSFGRDLALIGRTLRKIFSSR